VQNSGTSVAVLGSHMLLLVQCETASGPNEILGFQALGTVLKPNDPPKVATFDRSVAGLTDPWPVDRH